MSSSLFVTPQWLAAHLADQDIQLLDARLAPPGSRADPAVRAESVRLPGALRFDIDALSDHASPLPHMMPSAADFGTAMRALGVDSRRHLVIYDDGTLFSAPRAWWMLRTFGAPRVSLLAGGSLPGNAWDFLCIRGLRRSPRRDTSRLSWIRAACAAPRRC